MEDAVSIYMVCEKTVGREIWKQIDKTAEKEAVSRVRMTRQLSSVLLDSQKRDNLGEVIESIHFARRLATGAVTEFTRSYRQMKFAGIWQKDLAPL